MSVGFKDPIQKIYDDAFERISYDIAYEVTYIAAKFTESPIERLLYGALYSAVHFSTRGSQHTFRELVKAESEIESYEAAYQPSFLYIRPQAKVLSYRADFLVFARNPAGAWQKLVVECDGHDFHERTKDQAAHDRSRDRAMQEAGYSVFRFTGSEIYRDPCGCADQVLAWANKVTWE